MAADPVSVRTSYMSVSVRTSYMYPDAMYDIASAASRTAQGGGRGRGGSRGRGSSGRGGHQRGTSQNAASTERRMAPDGLQYSMSEFEQFFGGLDEWNAATRSTVQHALEQRLSAPKQPAPTPPQRQPLQQQPTTERRLAPNGSCYTQSEFQSFFSGLAEWNVAVQAQPKPPPPPPREPPLQKQPPTPQQQQPPQPSQPSGDGTHAVENCTGRGQGAAVPTERGQERLNDVAEEAARLLQRCSLSPQQQAVWSQLSLAVAAATPGSREAKKGPPDVSVLEAIRSARQARDAFVAGLSSEQQLDAKRLLESEKQERKLRNKEEAALFKAEAGQLAGMRPDAAVLTPEQKQVMSRAFWLYQQDRQKASGTQLIDSTEWKHARALGSASPLLSTYLQRAGWDLSWPELQPEGRLLRREGQQAALARYSQGNHGDGRRSR